MKWGQLSIAKRNVSTTHSQNSESIFSECVTMSSRRCKTQPLHCTPWRCVPGMSPDTIHIMHIVTSFAKVNRFTWLIKFNTSPSCNFNNSITSVVLFSPDSLLYLRLISSYLCLTLMTNYFVFVFFNVLQFIIFFFILL